jgi:thiol-disulfide isomerase/thioredoxin
MIRYLTSLLVAATLISCAEDKPSYVVIHGAIDNNDSESLMVYGNELDASIEIDENASFRDTLEIPQDGYYTLRIGRERTSIYLTKGSELGVTVNAPEFDESIVYTGNLAAENNYLAAKYLLSEQEKSFSEIYKMNEEDFLNEIKEMKSKYVELLNSSENLSESFIKQETKELEYEKVVNHENYKAYYIYLTGDKSFDVSDNFYDSLMDIDYKDTTEYRISEGYRKMLLTHYGRLADEGSDKEEYNKTVSFLSLVDESLPKGFAKDQVMFDFLKYNLKADSYLEKAYTIFKEANSNEANLNEVTDRYKLLNTIVPGKRSPQFEYENFKGGTSSLNEFEGKYVYLDIWATWCGPCKREIPHLKKIEEDYKDKNLAIISISIDVKKDYDKWREMVEEKELGGTQLFADNDWSSKFIKDYGIKGIPRFILLDKQGNIVSSDAPRPSNSDLRDLLDGFDI